MSTGETIVSTLKAKLLLDTLGFTQAADTATQKVNDIATKFKQVGAVTAGVVKDTVSAAMNFETAFTGVTKTVEAPENTNAVEFFSNLRNEILDMSKELPVSAEEIAGVYQAAGQLGIQSENLTTFSRAMLELSSATNLTSEEAATTLAQFANVMQTDQTLFENMGSSIVALGNNFATNERQVVNFAREMAIAGKLAGMSEADVLGFGTAMASMGLEAASSGTAFQRFGQTITNAVAKNNEDLSVLAKTAGMTTQEFKTAWEEDATGALITFLEGLGELSSADQLKVFDNLDIAQQQEITMLQSLASNTDLVKSAVNMSNDAWNKNTALSTEAGTANSTTAAQFQMLKNNISALAITIGDVLLPIFNDILEFITPLIEKFRTFAEEHPTLTKVILGTGLALGVIGSVITTLLPLITAISGAGGLAAIGTALGGILVPALPVIAIIGAIIGVILLLKAAIENNFLGLGDRFEELKAKISPALESIKGYFSDLKTTFEEGGFSAVFEKIGNDAAGLWENSIKPWFDQIGDNIRNFFTDFDLRESVREIGIKIGEKVSGFWDESIKPWFDQIGDNIRNFFLNLEISESLTAFIESVKTKFEELKTAVNEKLEPIKEKWEEIKTAISEKIEALKTKFEEFKTNFEELKTAISEKVDALKTKFEEIKTKISDFFQNLDISESLTNFVNNIGDNISNGWENIKNVFSGENGLFGKIKSWITGINLTEAAAGLIDSLKSGISGAIDNIKNIFAGSDETSLIGKIKGWLSGSDILNIGANLINKIKEGIEGAWDSFTGWFSDKWNNFTSGISNILPWNWGKDKKEEPETDETIDMPENMLTLNYKDLKEIPDKVIESYERFKNVIQGINDTVQNLTTLLQGAFLQAFSDFTAYQFDESILEGWYLLRDALQGVADSLMSIMVILTGGQLATDTQAAEMGSESAGAPMVEGLEAFAEAAAELAPVIDNSINPVLNTMDNYSKSVYKHFQSLVDLWLGQFKQGVKKFIEYANQAEAATKTLAIEARNAEGAFHAWADAINRVIDALKKLAEVRKEVGDDGTGGVHTPRRAEGGPVKYGTTYLVGEEGPELFTPSRSGYIVPNNELTGSNGQQINIEINGSIYGESYLEEFVVEALTETIKKELRYAY